MRSTRGRIKLLICSERFKLFRLEASLVITVEPTYSRSRERDATLVDGSTNQGVEFRQYALGRVDDLGLVMEEIDEHESRVFINKERGIAKLAADRDRERAL
jgi:hypothetical protein